MASGSAAWRRRRGRSWPGCSLDGPRRGPGGGPWLCRLPVWARGWGRRAWAWCCGWWPGRGRRRPSWGWRWRSWGCSCWAGGWFCACSVQYSSGGYRDGRGFGEVEARGDALYLGQPVAGQHLQRQVVQAAGLGRAAVGQQGHREVAHERRADRGLHAQVRDHAADDQVVHAEAAQQRLERGPLERVEAHLVNDGIPRPAATLGHHLGVPGAALQAVEAG